MLGNPTLTKNYEAGAVIAKHRIVKFGADDDHVIQSAAATDDHIGVSDELGATAAEKRVDVHHAGIVTVEYGGTVTRGGPLTADADGKAVAAAPATGVNNPIIGRALVSAVAGDLGPMLIAPSVTQGA